MLYLKKIVSVTLQNLLLRISLFAGCLLWTVLTDPHCPNPNAPTSSWYVVSENFDEIVNLTCSVPDIYPFCDPEVLIDPRWTLPKELLSYELPFYGWVHGWKPLENGMILQINRTKIPAGVRISGLYECSAIAPDPMNRTLHSLYRLAVGVDMFEGERLLIQGPGIVRYSRRLITGFIGLGVCVFVLAIIKVLIYCSYDSRVRRSEAVETTRSMGSVDSRAKAACCPNGTFVKCVYGREQTASPH